MIKAIQERTSYKEPKINKLTAALKKEITTDEKGRFLLHGKLMDGYYEYQYSPSHNQQKLFNYQKNKELFHYKKGMLHNPKCGKAAIKIKKYDGTAIYKYYVNNESVGSTSTGPNIIQVDPDGSKIYTWLCSDNISFKISEDILVVKNDPRWKSQVGVHIGTHGVVTFYSKGKIHRDKNTDLKVTFYLDGQETDAFHDKFPAVIDVENRKRSWYSNGMQHRIGFPAVEYEDYPELNEFWINGTRQILTQQNNRR